MLNRTGHVLRATFTNLENKLLGNSCYLDSNRKHVVPDIGFHWQFCLQLRTANQKEIFQNVTFQ